MLFSAKPVLLLLLPLFLLLLLLIILSAELPSIDANVFWLDPEVKVEHDYFELGHVGNVSNSGMITD